MKIVRNINHNLDLIFKVSERIKNDTEIEKKS